MTKKILHILFGIGFIALFFAPKNVIASHVAGGDISYTCIGPNTFEVTVNFFRDCSGISAPPSVSLNMQSSCGTIPNETLQLQTSWEVSQLCPSQIQNSTCNDPNNPNALPGMQHYVYTGIVVLNPRCNVWSLSTSVNARNTADNTGGGTFYVEATVNSIGDSCNNSPVFEADPIPYICINQLKNYNFQASEPDGDSLVYSFTDPIISNNNGAYTYVNWNPGYSTSQPLPGISLNTSTGQVAITPTAIGKYTLAIMVCEYEYGTGVLLGCVTRDIQFVVINCSNQSPLLEGFKNFTGAGALLDSLTIEVCTGDSFSFDIEFPDPDTLDTVNLSSNIDKVLPGATVVYTAGNPGVMSVSYVTQPGIPPFNSFSVFGYDNACPIVGIVSGSFVIKVIQSTYAGPDDAICQGIEWTQLRATGGTVFDWTLVSGSPIDTNQASPGYNMSCTHCANPMVSPQVTTTYKVTSNLSSACLNTDSVTIRAASDYIPFSGPDTLICDPDSIQMFCGANIPGNFTYRWDQIRLLDDYTIQNPKTQPPAATKLTHTVYTVTMTSDSGCTKVASHSIGKIAPMPDPTISATPENICFFGDTTDLLIDLGSNFTTTCVGLTTPCDNQGYTTDILLDFDPVDGQAGPVYSMTNTQYPAPFGHSKKSSKQQYLYLARELQDMGLQAGMITELGFFITALHGTTLYKDYSIKMGCTSLLSMPATLFDQTPLVTVFPTQDVNITTGWNMMAFSSPYVWDGTSNLLVEICFDSRALGASTFNSLTRTREFKPTSPSNRKFLPSLSLGIDTGNACTGIIGDVPMFVRPDTRFKFCYGYDPDAFNYNWWPNKHISDTTAQNPRAWPDTTTTYNVIVQDTHGICADTSSIEITVAHFDAGPDTLICEGDTIQLRPESFDMCNVNQPIVFWYSNLGGGIISVNGITPTVTADTTTIFYANYTNFCGCTVIDSVIVHVNKMDEPNLVFTEPDCGQSNGAILVHSAGGTAPYTFSADGGQTFQVDSLFTNLPKALYHTQYMDSNGCLSPMRSDTLQNINTAKIDSIITNDPICYSSATGIIDIYITGGQAPHEYSIDTGNTWHSNSTFNNVAPGTYIVLARDANLCVSFPDTVTINSNSQLLLDSVLFTNLKCFQDASGTIDVFGQGGTPPYTYSVDSGLVYQSSNSFAGLQADTHYVVIKDAVGCTSTPYPQVLQEGVTITATFNITNDSCYNACGGANTVSISGATLPVTYSWRKGVNPIGGNSSTVSNLCAGTDYELSITDSNNCNQVFPFTVDQPDEIIVSFNAQNSSCFGADDGMLTISATGGTLGQGYRYSINNGVSFRNNPVFTGLSAGTYNIVVADSGMRCTGTTTAIITEPQEVELTTNITQGQVCISGCIPLQATAVGGAGAPYNFIWSHNFDSNSAQIACPTQPTVYSVYAVDSAGCTSSPKLIQISIHDSLIVDAGFDKDICPGGSTELNATPLGGSGVGYTYQWSPVGSLNNSFIQNPMASPLVSTLYTVKLTDNCETPPAYDTVWVNVHPLPTMDFYTNDTTSGCEPFDITLINASSPVQIAEWTVSNGDQTLTAHGFQVDLTDLSAGVYDVNLRVISPQGCENDITKSQFFEVFPEPTAIFDMDPSETTVFNTKIQFEDQSIGNVQAWVWDFAGIGASSDQHPLFEFPADSGTYPITLTVTTDKLCEDDVTELLRIGSEFNIYVPNSFTPNGDGQNDVFAPRGIGIDPTKYSLQIFDRWGAMIFESSDLNQPWDGRYQGTTKMAANGVYIWKIVAHDATDEANSHKYHGTVNLIR